MAEIVFESVEKRFRHRPALFNWLGGGKERGGETLALRGVSFSVAGGEVLALLGPNGSGKTSALKLVSTVLLPDAGSVRVGGFDAQSHSLEVRRQVGIAVASERSFFPRLTGRENLAFFAALDEVPRGERAARIEAVLSDAGLEDQSDTLAMKFSSGMCQRLGIARALVKRPRVLLLDEPTRSLDAAATANFWATIKSLARRETTIVIATHNFAEASAVANRVILFNRGQLLADRSLDANETGESLRSFYFRLTGETDDPVAAGL